MNYLQPEQRSFNNLSIKYFVLASLAIHFIFLINWIAPKVINKPTQAVLSLKINNYLPPASKAKAIVEPVQKAEKVEKKILKKTKTVQPAVKKTQPVQKTPPVKKQETVPETVETAVVAQTSQQVSTISNTARTNYENILAAWLAKHKRYPSHALRRRMTGTALLSVTINAEGKLLNYQINDSTGHEILDDAVIAMLKRAEPLPEIPAEFMRNSYDFRVPVSFELK